MEEYFLTHLFHLSSVICQSCSESSSGVPLLIVPANLLTKHRLEATRSKTSSQPLTSNNEKENLKGREMM